ncbi:MAG: DUF1311 domain-containing protein [Bdellovibrionales bacterium]|nr:DUF1311 domain-containing protein [Bdellovibrionales bacterium]NQZ18665.1 DUF1311 domain-containing protein [Bdellovibrionales bacterium]
MRLLIIFLSVVLPIFVFAESSDELLESIPDQITLDSYENSLNICKGPMSEDVSSATLSQCESEVAKSLEEVLDQALDETKLKFGASEVGRELRGRFMMAHGSWLSLRTSECQFKGGLRRLGGSGEGIDILRCHNQMTVNRINEYSRLEL